MPRTSVRWTRFLETGHGRARAGEGKEAKQARKKAMQGGTSWPNKNAGRAGGGETSMSMSNVQCPMPMSLPMSMPMPTSLSGPSVRVSVSLTGETEMGSRKGSWSRRLLDKSWGERRTSHRVIAPTAKLGRTQERRGSARFRELRRADCCLAARYTFRMTDGRID